MKMIQIIELIITIVAALVYTGVTTCLCWFIISEAEAAALTWPMPITPPYFEIGLLWLLATIPGLAMIFRAWHERKWNRQMNISAQERRRLEFQEAILRLDRA